MRRLKASMRSASDGSDFAAASACSASSIAPCSSNASARASACSAADGSSFSKNARTWLSGNAPTNCAAGRPSLNAITFGIERMLNAPAISGLSSELTLTSLTLPANSAATFSMIGPSMRQGPHHGAQKSTTTGCAFEASRTSRSNVAVVTSIGTPLRRSVVLGILPRVALDAVGRVLLGVDRDLLRGRVEQIDTDPVREAHEVDED